MLVSVGEWLQGVVVAAKMNPLLAEYNKRLNSSRVPTARDAKELLTASIHEAGHWMAFAHYNIPVVEAKVGRGRHAGGGIVIPTDFLGFVPEEKEPEVDYISTLAGAFAVGTLEPFVERQVNLATSMNDIGIVKNLLDNVHGNDTASRKLFKEKNARVIEILIHQNWSVIEALAYELMKHGSFFGGECRKVEMRYGIGRHSLIATKLQSAQRRLEDFHSSPATLLTALLAMP